ncbi:YceD family protein [Tritonibacter multivorans]|nr:DUF177 domain-containing protein [Tritonibacter multivorans]MDA7420819.1 DUF177 domain-containing protein [Tritonibacter multivorans]
MSDRQPQNAPAATALRVADLPQNAATPFEFAPDAKALGKIAAEMGVDALRKLRFKGEIRGTGQKDWRLTADLGFTVVQPCVVTLEPVTSRVDVKIERTFLAGFQEEFGEDEEVEMPEDDTVEPLGSHIDPYEVMLESLALNLPQYPRKDGAALGESVHTEPGVAPMRDEDTRPFAGLAALKDQLENKG